MNTETNTQPTITLAVTAYKRPQYTEEAIKSFLYQDYTDSEMLIVDDSLDDARVAEVVQRYSARDSRIRLTRNQERLGYCKNFLKSLTESRGKYIITLGDDDILLTNTTLRKYVDTFERYPDVNYIYSNMIQINSNMEIDFIFELFATDQYCDDIDTSLKTTWLRSCFIAGIGLRNTKNFTELYPIDDILFPQVELIGKILGTSSSYALAERLIGARAHLAQLGNVALTGKNIKGSEKHSVYELDVVYDRVNNYYKNKLGKCMPEDRSFIYQFFEQNHKAIFANEKISNGNKQILNTFVQAVKNNPRALIDLPFTLYFVVALMLPRSVLFALKEKYKKATLSKYKGVISEYIKHLEAIKSV